jgi:DNA/RNA-binding domain of Phe-tRNA-synthetase-like protein
MDSTGHSQLAEWTGPGTDFDRAATVFRDELEEGYIGVWDHRDGTATQVRELPQDADLVILRRPIAGG